LSSSFGTGNYTKISKTSKIISDFLVTLSSIDVCIFLLVTILLTDEANQNIFRDDIIQCCKSIWEMVIGKSGESMYYGNAKAII
jgi:hypothetical protein